jgi:ABC-2 type transport system ATP-binding protein
MSEVENVAQRVAIIRAGKIIEVADTESLTRRTLNRFVVRFREKIDISQISRISGVTILSKNGSDQIKFQTTGDIQKVIQTLGALPIQDLETEHPSLEEIFLTYYK